MNGVHRFDYRGKRLELRLSDEGILELCLEGVVRKRRPPSGPEPVYLWTNVELQWEEHHFVEVRYWRSSGRLLVTVNGKPVHEGPWLVVAGSATQTASRQDLPRS